MKFIVDRIVVVFCKITARLPFWAIWGLADIFYLFLYYVVRYRRKTVRENLINSFPEKNSNEIRQITKKFYHHLCDLGLEVIKLNQMPEKEIDERFKVHGMEMYEDYYNQNKSVIVLGMHHNNWEWGASMQRFTNSQFLVVYNPVRSNFALERFILATRERFGAKTIQVNHSVRTVLELNRGAKPNSLILGADQTPPQNSQFWTTFLNQETAFFSGPMKIAIKTNSPVILHHSRKIGRSKYEVFHYKLVENPAEMKPEEIMMAYIRKIEEIIKAEPEYYLWSHRRWKHKRNASAELYESKD